MITNLQKIDLLDKAKNLFSSKDSQQSLLISRLLKDESKFRHALLLSRCIEEANLPSVQRKAELLQIYIALAKELFICRAHEPIDRYYQWWIDYLKLSPHLLDALDILGLLTQEKEITQDQKIGTRLDLTLSQLQAKDVVDSLIQLFNRPGDINVRCQAIESLALIVTPQERIRFMNALLDCVKNEISFVSLTATKVLLKIDPRIENLSWLLKHFLCGNENLKREVLQFFLNIKEDMLLAQLCLFDQSLKDWLIKRISFFNWLNNKQTILQTLQKTEVAITVIGGYCGKSCLVVRFIQGSYLERLGATIEDSYRTRIELNEQSWVIDIMDTSSYDEYSVLRDLYIRTSEIIIICFDITSKSSFEKAINFCKQADRLSKSMILAGLKKDLENERQISFQEGKKLAERYETVYIECSAKTNENVTELFILATEIVSLKRRNISLAQTKEFIQEKERIKTILAPASILAENKSQLMSVLRVLEKEQNALVKKWSENLITKINIGNHIEICILSLIQNMQYSDTLIQQISNERLTELEKTYSNKIVQVYSEYLIESDIKIIRTILARLSHLGKLYEREVISACIKMLAKDNVIREISEESLFEWDVTRFDERQCFMLYEVCVKNLDNLSLPVRMFALNNLQRLKKTNTSEVITAHIINLTHINVDINETAAQALQELEGELNEVQHQALCDTYKKDLCEANTSRRQRAVLAIKRLGKAEAPEVIAVHIENLTHTDNGINETAAHALLELGGKLNEMQRQTIFDICVKDLCHVDLNRRHRALLAIKQMGKAEAPEVIATHINNLTHKDRDIYERAAQALLGLQEKLSEMQRQTVFDICVKDLRHVDSNRRHRALLAIKRMGKAEASEVIAAHINNLTHKDGDIYKTAVQALLELQEKLSEMQRQTIFDIYVKDLCHVDLDRRLRAALDIKRLCKAETSKLIAVHINNLTHEDKGIYKTAAQELLKLEAHLSEAQHQVVIMAHIKNLTHKDEVIYKTAAQALLQLELKLDKTHRELVNKLCLENLCHAEISVQLDALKRLQHLAITNSFEFIKTYINHLINIKKFILMKDIHYHIEIIKNLWSTFDKKDKNIFKLGLLNHLRGEITETNMIAVMLLLSIEPSKRMLSQLIKPLLNHKIDILTVTIQYLLDIGEDMLLAQLCQLDLELKAWLAKASLTNWLITNKIDLTQINLTVPIDLKVSICLIGEGAFGKRKALGYFQFHEDPHKKSYDSTFESRDRIYVDINDQSWSLDILDIDIVRSRSLLIEQYIKTSKIIVIYFNIVDKSSFDYASKLCQYLIVLSKPFLLIGLSKGLKEKSKVLFQAGVELANHYYTNYTEYLVNTNENLNEIFISVLKKILAFESHDSRIRSILAPTPMSDNERKNIKEHLENLQNDPHSPTKEKAKILLADLNTRSLLEINIRMHIDNMVASEAILRSLSIERLSELERKHLKIMIEIYIKCFKDTDPDKLRVIIDRLRQIKKLYKPTVIAACFTTLGSENESTRAIMGEVLSEMDTRLFNNEQRNILAKFYIHNLAHPHQQTREKALAFLEKLGKGQLPEVIAAKKSMLAQSSIEQFEEKNHLTSDQSKLSNSVELNNLPILQQDSFVKNENNICLDNADAVYQTFPETESSDSQRENLNQPVEPKYAALISKQNNPVFNRVSNQDQALTETLQESKNNHV